MISKLSESNLSPFVKWVGGKRTLVAHIVKMAETVLEDINCYHEPFIGGGAVFLGLRPRKAIINDLNKELIFTYRCIKKDPQKLFDLICTKRNTKEFFLEERRKDRSPDFHECSEFERAARLIYLNKTCFNGMWRENGKGQFNVPYADNDMKPDKFLNLRNALKVSEFLNKSDVEILNETYSEALSRVQRNDLVYLDPPYMPISDTSSFTSYTKHSFGWEEQLGLKKVCDNIDEKNAYFILSNSNHPEIVQLYNKYRVEEVDMRRSINSKGNRRGKIKELLITNIPI